MEEGRLPNTSDVERKQYEASLKEYWDYTSTIDTAYGKGRKAGKEEGIKEIAKKMKTDGLTLEMISKYTGLPIDEIEKL